MFCQQAPSIDERCQLFEDNYMDIVLPSADRLTSDILRLQALSGTTQLTGRSETSCSDHSSYFFHNPSDTESVVTSEDEKTSPTPDHLICSIPFEFGSIAYRTEVSPSVGSARRKQFLPQRSTSRDDPNFRGAVITMETRMQASEPVLIMKSEFRHIGEGKISPSRRQPVTRHRLRKRKRSLNSDASNLSTSESEEERYFKTIPAVTKHHKRCTSCGTKRTPLWRDIEKSVPLCNACGIRYKKYKTRCSKCWHVPRRNRTISCSCISCGSPMQFNHKPVA